MKPAPFEYSRPASLDEACALLAADDGARIIAGGQTLVPLMAMRLARPTRLVDIARIPELAFIREEPAAVRSRESGDPGPRRTEFAALGSRLRGSGRGEVVGESTSIVIGATTRQCVVENDALVRAKLPLLHRAMPCVGHGATRARGTIGGSLANGDPAAEIALVAVTLGAALQWREGGRTAEVSAAEFFLGPMLTTLPAAACLEAVRFPVWSEPRLGTSFHEVNARKSDFAFVSAAAQIALGQDGRCQRIAVGIGAVAATPLCLDLAGLEGSTLEDQRVREAVEASLATIEPLADLHASADYRRRVAKTLAIRAIADAYRDAHAR
jgi:CO/xanthine dehydrogenase FAD-binding subunit